MRRRNIFLVFLAFEARAEEKARYREESEDSKFEKLSYKLGLEQLERKNGNSRFEKISYKLGIKRCEEKKYKR